MSRYVTFAALGLACGILIQKIGAGLPPANIWGAYAIGVAWHLRGMLNPTMRSLFDGVAA